MSRDTADAVFAKLLSDLRQQLEAATTAKAEGREDLDQRLLVSFDLCLRAARSAAERLVSAGAQAGVVPAVLDPAKSLLAAYEAFQSQSVDAREHLAELATGWRCARCGVASPASAKLAPPPDTGLPSLECRACGADTPVTAAGEEAYARLFGALASSPAWNPRANGFEIRPPGPKRAT